MSSTPRNPTEAARVEREAVSAIRSIMLRVGIPLLALFLMLATVAYVGQHLGAVIVAGIRCNLDQNVEHRASSITHEAQSAGEHGDTFTQPLGINPPSQAAVLAAKRDLVKSCRRFFPPGIRLLEPTPTTEPAVTRSTLVGTSTTTTVRYPPLTSSSTRTTARTTRASSTATTQRQAPTTTMPPTPPTTANCVVPFNPCPL